MRRPRDVVRRRRTEVAFAAVVACLALAGCSSPDGPPPERADYTLQWYPDGSTDYGPLTPGFKTLSMCRRAGAGATWRSLTDRGLTNGSSSTAKPEEQPWFECMSSCRPHMPNSYLLVCKYVAEFRGERALYPNMVSDPARPLP